MQKHIQQLPESVASVVFSFLETKSVMRELLFVDRNFYRIIKNNPCLNIKIHGLIKDNEYFYKNIVSLHVSWVAYIDFSFNWNFSQNMRNIRHLQLSGGDLDLLEDFRIFNNLDTLSISIHTSKQFHIKLMNQLKYNSYLRYFKYHTVDEHMIDMLKTNNSIDVLYINTTFDVEDIKLFDELVDIFYNHPSMKKMIFKAPNSYDEFTK
jgi:hypothetical protein